MVETLTVKFLDLSSPPIEAIEAARKIASSGWYVSGPAVGWFEGEWAAKCGAEHCIGCGSGGSALVLALRSLYMPHGARVVVPALTFAATAMAVIEAGGQPVYCDVDEHGLIDLRSMATVADEHRAWGVIPVHLYGQLVDMEAVMGVAEALRLVVIEDAAQAHGELKRVHGDVATFSFYPGKNLGAFGEAGALVTDNSALADTAFMLTNYGVEAGQKYEHRIVGSNLRMDEIQAAVLSAKLPFLKLWNARREEVAQLYDVMGVKAITKGGNRHLYPVRVKDPTQARNILREAGVATGLHYPQILPATEALFMPGQWPVADDLARHHITLPIGPHLTEDDVVYVAERFLEVTQ